MLADQFAEACLHPKGSTGAVSGTDMDVATLICIYVVTTMCRVYRKTFLFHTAYTSRLLRRNAFFADFRSCQENSHEEVRKRSSCLMSLAVSTAWRNRCHLTEFWVIFSIHSVGGNATELFPQVQGKKFYCNGLALSLLWFLALQLWVFGEVDGLRCTCKGLSRSSQP